jgi:hypothetical protein
MLTRRRSHAVLRFGSQLSHRRQYRLSVDSLPNVIRSIALNKVTRPRQAATTSGGRSKLSMWHHTHKQFAASHRLQLLQQEHRRHVSGSQDLQRSLRPMDINPQPILAKGALHHLLPDQLKMRHDPPPIMQTLVPCPLHLRLGPLPVVPWVEMLVCRRGATPTDRLSPLLLPLQMWKAASRNRRASSTRYQHRCRSRSHIWASLRLSNPCSGPL